MDELITTITTRHHQKTHVLFYRAAIDLSCSTPNCTPGILRRHCKAIGSPLRRLNPGKQVLLVLVYLSRGETFTEAGAGRSRLAQRYPGRALVPFARRQDNDDVACWEAHSGKVVVVHDFASPGSETRAEFPDFYAWLRQAVEDSIESD